MKYGIFFMWEKKNFGAGGGGGPAPDFPEEFPGPHLPGITPWFFCSLTTLVQSIIRSYESTGFLWKEERWAKAETPVLWPPHAKSWLIGKDSDAERDWGQEEKGTTEDEMAGWHHGLDGCESEWTPGVGDGQGGLVCCDSWGCKELDTTEWLNWTELNWTDESTFYEDLLYPRLYYLSSLPSSDHPTIIQLDYYDPLSFFQWSWEMEYFLPYQ